MEGWSCQLTEHDHHNLPFLLLPPKPKAPKTLLVITEAAVRSTWCMAGLSNMLVSFLGRSALFCTDCGERPAASCSLSFRISYALSLSICLLYFETSLLLFTTPFN